MYGARRRRAWLGTAAVLLLAYLAFSGPASLPNEHGHTPNDWSRVLDKERTDPRAVGWPQIGHAAFVLGKDRPSASPDQQPAPIASLA